MFRLFLQDKFYLNLNKHYMRRRPSITCKTLFDLVELPWFWQFSNAPVPICLCFLDAPEQRNQLATKQLESVEVDIANQNWLLGADIRWQISS